MKTTTRTTTIPTSTIPTSTACCDSTCCAPEDAAAPAGAAVEEAPATEAVTAKAVTAKAPAAAPALLSLEDPAHVREAVRAYYAERAVTGSSCCGPSCGCGPFADGAGNDSTLVDLSLPR